LDLIEKRETIGKGDFRMEQTYVIRSEKKDEKQAQRLVEGLNLIPQQWKLTPLIQKKPYRDNWQGEGSNSKDALIQVIRDGERIWNESKQKFWTAHPTGYGIRLGRISGGIIAIDFDGQSAWELAQELSSGKLPDTVSFTSKRPGRHQRLYRIPEEYWGAIATKKIKTGVKGDDGKQEQLEFRWDGTQSVLPPSKHPDTGQYVWINSPQDIEVADAPMWLIEQMLPEPTPEPRRACPPRLPNPSTSGTLSLSKCSGQRTSDWTDIDWALSYLNALAPYRADDYDNWLTVGMALHSVDDSLLTEWDAWSQQSPKYKPGECQKKWNSFKRTGVAIGTLGQMAKEDGWKSPFGGKTNSNSRQEKVAVNPKNGSVTGDSHSGGDSCNLEFIDIAATVTTVTEILKSGYLDWEENHKLEAVRVKSELNNKQAFSALVNAMKTQLDEVQSEDEVRLQSLIDWHNAELDFDKALPSMAADILHDAKILNIDPIGIWQYLFPAVLSLAGKRVDLDVESHQIPAIAWTAILAESGTGKTRAKTLVTAPLKQLQKAARERFEAENKEWENWEGEGDEKKPPKPVERKYTFEVGTIQAIMRRQSEQGLNGSLLARDELLGLFQSLNQFDKKENEGLSCLITGWDGGSSQVDRVNQEDSYFVEATRLSIAGGLQPGVFKKAFKDPNDSQGLQARFLFAAMKPRKPKRTKGFCHLSEKLPQMYQWLDNLPEGKIKLSRAADAYYDRLYEEIGEQVFNTSMPAIRAWMFKLPGQLLRIALALHLIECYYEPDRPFWELQKDTLERAVLFAQYYRSTFHIVQTTAANTDDISAILLQIWDKAVTRHPEGISTRDAYREIKAIQSRAKDAGRPVSAYTADLFAKLEQMGKGTVVKKGRKINFVATLNSPPISPIGDGDSKTETDPSGDRVTEAENVVKSVDTTVTPNEVSPGTVTSDSHSITDEVSDSDVTQGGATEVTPAVASDSVQNPGDAITPKVAESTKIELNQRDSEESELISLFPSEDYSPIPPSNGGFSDWEIDSEG
jgi:hypothetical protein